MKNSTVGTFVGLILGLVLVLEGFGEMLIVALGGAIGYFVARVAAGDLDLEELIGRSSGQSSGRGRRASL